jgi:hypothetical protein
VVSTGSCMAERASVACTQKILRILLLRPENSARGLQEIIIIRGVYRFALVRHTELTKSDTPLATRALGIG